ncbi:HD family phosphohydrolase [Geomobilimonas luticola]|uniref:HD family phosphohydrolase n=1 Tax=Geomobilimonas luticola TaxID=1114878 RepID=UPI001FE44BDB|nr:HDIG domain-containing metalloprotein [Geomobilimonas luticola]
MPTQTGDKNKPARNSLVLIAEHFLDSLVERFAGGRHEQRNRFILLFLAAAILAFLIIPGKQFHAVSYKVGDIATSDIRATQDYLLEDHPLTEKKRAEAESVAPFVYDFNTSAAEEITLRFEKGLALVREAMGQEEGPDIKNLRDVVSKSLGVELSPVELGALLAVRSDRTLLTEIGRITGQIYSQRIVVDRQVFSSDMGHGILIVDAETRQVIAAGNSTAYIGLADARNALERARMSQGGGQHTLATVKEILARMLKPNLTFNREATNEKKREAREAVRPVLFQLKQGEMIVRVGERITAEQALKLQRIAEARKGMNRVVGGVGIYGLVLILFYLPYRFARKNIRKFNPSNKDLLLLAFITICSFLLLKTVYIVSTVMGGIFPSIDTANYYYLFPFAVGAILVRIILNSEVALVHTAICAPLFGIMFNNSLPVVIYSLLGGVVGAHGVRQCKDRGTIYKAGAKVSVANLALAISFQIVGDSLFSMQSLYCIVFALAGGIINAAFVTGIIPILEGFFHYTTDIKLLELANLNSPILRELMIRAPGTYHHSVLVGNMVESAAEEINANPLLARVAAYYHDVGKISKPLYFIENVGGGENRHDKLSPNMSALILIAHVKEGVELAREHRLGLPIIDIIRQSHGTSLITFFHDKAKKLAGEGKTVDEREFRYPGPKPQTREAGLVLLADCVEAASRTLTDPTPARIQGLVQKIINKVFIDGQLDECELTLKNLHGIAKSFNRILGAIYHHRIDYPEPAYKEKTAGGKKTLEDSHREPPETPSGQHQEPEKSGGEDLKRLGITH